jgi:hypothetical protein
MIIEMVKILCIILLFIIITGLIGYLLSKLLGWEDENPFLIGYFVYFAVFHVLALPMIIFLQPLSKLSRMWLGVLLGVVSLLGVIYFIKQYVHKKRATYVSYLLIEKKLYNIYFQYLKQILFWCVVLIIAAQILYALLHTAMAWDSAFYIPNVNTAIKTDSMYLYDGNSGKLLNQLNIRYAMCTFFMHDAVIGQVFQIEGVLVCRYFNIITCNIYSALIVYQIGKLFWKEQKWSYLLVIFWGFINLGFSYQYFTSAFLLTRGWEAKAVCANIIVPGLIYEILKLYQMPRQRQCWIMLFIMNLVSVGLSSSALLLVPVINGCMLGAHIIVSREWKDLMKAVFCMLPSVAYLMMYILFQNGTWCIPIGR